MEPLSKERQNVLPAPRQALPLAVWGIGDINWQALTFPLGNTEVELLSTLGGEFDVSNSSQSRGNTEAISVALCARESLEVW